MKVAISNQEQLDAALRDLSGELVTVRRQWNDYREGQVPLAELSDFRLDAVSGGVQGFANRPYVHAYMWCNALVSGEIAHSCAHGPGPHWIKVCLLKKNNPKTHHVMKAAAELRRQNVR